MRHLKTFAFLASLLAWPFSVVLPAYADSVSAASVGNSVTTDKEFDYLLESNATKISYADSDKAGRSCYNDLETVKAMMRADGVLDVQKSERAHSAWLKDFDECRNPGLSFTNEAWWSINFGQWLGLGANIMHPKMHALAMQWMVHGETIAFQTQNVFATKDSCFYLGQMASSKEYHCWDSTIAWANGEQTESGSMEPTYGSYGSNSEANNAGVQQQEIEQMQIEQDQERRQQEQQEQMQNAAAEQQQRMQNNY